jgi:hypothetical protein
MALRVSNTEIVSDARALLNITGAVGAYDSFQPNVTAVAASALVMTNPMMTRVMGGPQTFTITSITLGASSVLLLDTSASTHLPTFPTSVKWPTGVTPAWGTYRYWLITFVGYSGSILMANAAGYTLA